ncbi:MAG: NTP transferase domain-containing protein [Clostridium sp.]|uniref:NTP transferase domain-containing protein n=1 Tax=Clostridium sp. TaxID=1506 RepID=UPI0025C0C2DC|nr:NTP transferase domain-containing protein [Clostridium sp.]MCF0149274.1 NTP transferase domain-containing protein [Clostridium sp.]
MNGIILASGFSKRMGINKLLMNYGEEVILQKVIREIKKTNIIKLILVAREESVIKLGIEEGIEVVKNEFADFGQSQSIRLGLDKADVDYDFMFFCGDQPFIDCYSINKLIDFSLKFKDSIVIPRVKDKVGSPVIFPRVLKSELESLEGDMGGRKVIKDNQDKVKYVDLNNELFLQDIDTLDDYMKFILNNK